MTEIIECEEFSEISIDLRRLHVNGEFTLDRRVATRGYLAAAMRGGEIVLRTTRFVGTIPLTPGLSVRVAPRAKIRNLSYMVVKSGVAATAISGFSRGYLPKFEGLSESEKFYSELLIEGVRKVERRGYLKSYVRPRRVPPWRGKVLVSATVRMYVSKGIRYRQAWEQSTLSVSNIENIAIKRALKEVVAWFRLNRPGSAQRREAERLLHGMQHVEDSELEGWVVVRELGNRIRSFPRQWKLYQEVLWVAYLVLQRVLPDVAREGIIPLQSLILDVSEVFEAYLRNELSLRLGRKGYQVDDGRRVTYRLFQEGGKYRVQPDMVIRQNDTVVAVMDAKYKPEPKEDDRYEVIAFMDALGVEIGGFVCPAVEEQRSRMLGTTRAGKELALLRYDLRANNPIAEVDRLFANVLTLLLGGRKFI